MHVLNVISQPAAQLWNHEYTYSINLYIRQHVIFTLLDMKLHFQTCVFTFMYVSKSFVVIMLTFADSSLA